MIRKGRKIFYFLFSVNYFHEIVELTEKNAFEKLNLAPTKLRSAKWIQSFIYFSKKKKEKRNETHVRLTKYYSTNIIIINAIFVTLKKIWLRSTTSWQKSSKLIFINLTPITLKYRTFRCVIVLNFENRKMYSCEMIRMFVARSFAHLYKHTNDVFVCTHHNACILYKLQMRWIDSHIFFRRWLKYIHKKRVDNWWIKWKCTCGDTVIHLIASFDLFTWLLSTNIQMLRTNLLIVHADRRPDWCNYFGESNNSIAVATPTTMPKKTNHMIE